MALKLSGSITVEIDLEEIVVDGTEFGIEEDGVRSLGDGDRQYEALFVYSDPASRFQLQLQATEIDGAVNQVTETTLTGRGTILNDDLVVEVVSVEG